VAILPALTTFLIFIHLLFVQTQGMAHSEESKKSMPFFPNFILRDLILWLFVLNILCVLGVFFPWELGKKADALASAPAGIKPEWYFLANYQVLKQLPSKILMISGELVGVLLFNIVGLVWFLIPFWEKLLPENKKNLTINILGSITLLYLLIMTAWGYWS
ncbi:MAG: cytochrome b N-terminal domain-containing protein, partial [Chlamydiota bacterium]|nr:cytochrome b N-terminal domain-containing protein [Chlamydiota bacterium]